MTQLIKRGAGSPKMLLHEIAVDLACFRFSAGLELAEYTEKHRSHVRIRPKLLLAQPTCHREAAPLMLCSHPLRLRVTLAGAPLKAPTRLYQMKTVCHLGKLLQRP